MMFYAGTRFYELQAAVDLGIYLPPVQILKYRFKLKDIFMGI